MRVGVLCAVSVCVGLFWGLHWTTVVPELAWLLGSTLIATIAVLWHRTCRLAAGVLLAMLLCGVSALEGHRAALAAVQTPLRQWLDERAVLTADVRNPPLVWLEGTLEEDAEVMLDGVRLRLAVSSVRLTPQPSPTSGRVMLTVGGDAAPNAAREWTQGRRVRVPARLRLTPTVRNRGGPSAWVQLVRRRGGLAGRVKSSALVEVVGPGSWWDERAASIRRGVREAITRRVRGDDPSSRAVATAILIGERTALDEDLERRLQHAGTFHTIAISGGNIAMLASAVVAVLWVCQVRFRIAAVTAAVVLLAHAAVIAPGASVRRATAMACLYLLLQAFDLRGRAGAVVAWSFVGTLLLTPDDVINAGFWLSYGATMALLATSTLMSVPSGWRGAMAAAVGSTAAVELMLAPVAAGVFERVTLAGLVLNLPAVPAMALVQAAASVTVLADWAHLPMLATAGGWCTWAGTRVLIETSRLVEWLPWLTWRIPPPGMWVTLVYYALLVVAWLRWRHWPPMFRRRAALGALGLWLWVAVAPWARLGPQGDGRLHLTMWDVGQGDALLVTFPRGQTLLIDAGGSPGDRGIDTGDRIVGPALRARGLVSVDRMLVTHGDADHIGGAATLVHEFRPREIWYGVAVDGHAAEQRLREAAVAVGASWRTVQRGDLVDIDGVRVATQHPAPPDWARRRVRNDDSVVLTLTLGQVDLWLTGDAGVEVEDAWVFPDAPRITVLKAGHHGSRTSTGEALVAALRPQVSLISAGRGNAFGHPAPEVLARLHAAGSVVERTDLEGQIDVRTDGTRVWLRRVDDRPQQWRLLPPASALRGRRAIPP
jgi:competence protein ComEC